MALSFQTMNANDVYNADTVCNANFQTIADNVIPIKIMTQTQYNNLATKDANTLYLVKNNNKIYGYVGTIPFAT